MNCNRQVSDRDMLARTEMAIAPPLSTSDQTKRLFGKKVVPKVLLDQGIMRRQDWHREGVVLCK